MENIKLLSWRWTSRFLSLWGFFLFFFLEDADLTDKQKKQTLNPHIELREYFFL